MTQSGMLPAATLNEAFLTEMFAYAEHSVFLTTLPNTKDARGGLRHERLSSSASAILLDQRDRVVSKYDRDGQAIYFCVSTLDEAKVETRRKRVLAETGKDPFSSRAKECVAEILAAHVDIDLKQVRLGSTDICHRLMTLRLKPSAVIRSGNGIHAYWFLTEAIEATQDFVLEFETLLRQIAFVMAGDPACCEVARLMRVPGSHNTKEGAFKPVDVDAQFSDLTRRYEIADLEEFFSAEPPVIAEHEIVQVLDKRTGAPRRATASAAPDNPFAAYVRAEVEAGRVALPPIDVERMLASMTPGDGEFGVHIVTRTVTASLVSRGWTPDEIVPFVIGGVSAMVAANGLPSGWAANWQVAEERKILGQIQGFERKQPPEKLAQVRERRAAEKRVQPAPRLSLVASAEAQEQAEAQADGTTGAAGNVVQFRIERRKAGRPKKHVDPRGPAHVRLAHLTLERMNLTGNRRICFWRGELWTYEDGIWRAFEGKDQNAFIETEIHATVRAVNEAVAELADEEQREQAETFDQDAKLRTETRRYICTMPDLRFSGQWDAHGLVPLANGLFNPATRTLTAYAPDHWATYRFAAPYDPAATFTHGEQMVADLFAGYGAEAQRYVWLMQQFAYVAIFKVGQQIGRQLRRCLYLQGEQNSGKSQFVDLLRSAIGASHCSATTLDEMSDPAQRRFALEAMMGKALWAADEAANERTRIDAARVKALLAEDIVKTDAKGKKAIEGRFLGAAIFSSNSYPRTLDSASGFSDRFMLVRCPGEFDNENPMGVARIAQVEGYSSPARFIAATELGGLVNWALGARDHIETRMAFEQPAAVVAARDEIADRSNPVRAFVKECIEAAPLDQASKSIDLYEAYREWHSEDHGSKTFCVAPKSFWTAFNACFGGRRGAAPKDVVKHKEGRLAVGVKLTAHGLDYWRAAAARKEAGDKGVLPGLAISEHSIAAYLERDQLVKAAQYFGFEVKSSYEGTDRTPRF